MRRVGRILLNFLILLTAAIGIGAGLLQGIWGLILLEDFKVEAFYLTHPLLRAMRDAPNHRTTQGEYPSATKILLDRIPLGTKRSVAAQIIAAENLKCDQTRALLDKDRPLICEAANRPCNATRWHIELRFDDQDNVVDGRAIPSKATCES
jgi:hypothetical protein